MQEADAICKLNSKSITTKIKIKQRHNEEINERLLSTSQFIKTFSKCYEVDLYLQVNKIIHT